jgi:hypothetical protein
MSKSKFAIGVVIVLLAIVGLKAVMTMNGPSDQVLVRQALTEAIKASKEGRAGGVMDYLSDQLKLNDQSPERRQIAEFIKNSHPDISVEHPDPVVREGDGTAQINSPVAIKFSLPMGATIDKTIPNVTMKFEREDARTWLVIPTKQWRLVEVTVPQASIPADLISAMGG